MFPVHHLSCSAYQFYHALQEPAVLEFVRVEVNTVDEAAAVLHLAKSRSSNWKADMEGNLLSVPNKAHLFVRIVINDVAKKQLSTLHIVDLAGSQNLSSHHASAQQHQEKLITNLQLLSFSNVVTELSKISTSQGASAAALDLLTP